MTIMEMAQDEDNIQHILIHTENMETIKVPGEDIRYWDFGWSGQPYINGSSIHLKVDGLSIHIKDHNCEYDDDYTMSPCQRLKQYEDIIVIEVIFKSTCLYKRLMLVMPWNERNGGENKNQTTTLKSYRECHVNIETSVKTYKLWELLDEPVGTIFVPIDNDELGDVAVTVGSLYDLKRLDFVRINKNNIDTLFIKKENNHE